METPNTAPLVASMRELGVPEDELQRMFRTYNAEAPAFRQVGDREGGDQS